MSEKPLPLHPTLYYLPRCIVPGIISSSYPIHVKIFEPIADEPANNLRAVALTPETLVDEVANWGDSVLQALHVYAAAAYYSMNRMNYHEVVP